MGGKQQTGSKCQLPKSESGKCAHGVAMSSRLKRSRLNTVPNDAPNMPTKTERGMKRKVLLSAKL